jgi:surfeit locus 1 family protein
MEFSTFVAAKNVVNLDLWKVELHRPSFASGRWLPEQTVLLDNRQMNGRPGFYVLTPLLLDGVVAANGKPLAVMVQRGWLPRDFLQRDRVPEIATPAELQRIPVRIAPPPARLLELGELGGAKTAPNDDLIQAGSSRIRQNLDLAAFAQTLAQSSSATVLISAASLLQTGAAQASGAAPDGLLREWPQADSGVAKHYGYAFQWFGLCALTAVLLLWFQVIAPRRKKKST